jgi:guanine deaminase
LAIFNSQLVFPMPAVRLIRGPLLNPRADGSVEFIPDAVLAADDRGVITFVGPAATAPPDLRDRADVRGTRGVIVPPFLDTHTHIPQHPIRGRFLEGVGAAPPDGALLAGLQRNVFPAELRCADPGTAREVVRAFRRDTLAHGVVGGAAYMTVHAPAARVALEELPATWSVGLVLMNQNCPDELRTDEAALADDVEALARDFGRRLIVTDRFAVAVNSPLRRCGAELAGRHGLRMQTHLNEQRGEKAKVERVLYRHHRTYADVYRDDGLLDHDAILAHCVHMRDTEFDILRDTGSSLAHCPTSNELLGSGIMPLDAVVSRGIPYALCTDVAASPTVSLLAEMATFLKVHADRSHHATPRVALAGVTVAPAKILGLDRELGSFEVTKPLSFVEIASAADLRGDSGADEVIVRALLGNTPITPSEPIRAALDRLQREGIEPGPDLTLLEDDFHRAREQLGRVACVVMRGEVVYGD